MIRLRSPIVVRLTVFATVLASLLATAPGVAADGEASGIVVTPPIAKAGDEILVQGFALWTELPVTVQLVAKTGASRGIGSGATGPDGSLNLAIRLPADIPAGQYTVLVLNVHGEEAGAPVVVEPDLPVLPLVVLGGALVAVGMVVVALLRRRGTGSEAPTG